jgi:hypothetical protein
LSPLLNGITIFGQGDLFHVRFRNSERRSLGAARAGHIQIRAHTKVLIALRSDTPTAFWFLALRFALLSTAVLRT